MCQRTSCSFYSVKSQPVLHEFRLVRGTKQVMSRRKSKVLHSLISPAFSPEHFAGSGYLFGRLDDTGSVCVLQKEGVLQKQPQSLLVAFGCPLWIYSLTHWVTETIPGGGGSLGHWSSKNLEGRIKIYQSIRSKITQNSSLVDRNCRVNLVDPSMFKSSWKYGTLNLLQTRSYKAFLKTGDKKQMSWLAHSPGWSHWNMKGHTHHSILS